MQCPRLAVRLRIDHLRGYLDNAMERFLRLMHILLVRKLAVRARQVVGETSVSHNHTMVLYLLSREFVALGPDLVPYFLREILAGSGRRTRGYAEFLQHVGDMRGVARFAGNAFMSSVLQRCRRLRMDEVTELLASPRPLMRIYHSGDVESRTPDQDYIPLGVRKSLARRPNPHTIEKLSMEQDPQVVRNLLSNPRITEEIVIKMASLRPTGQEVLSEIFNNHRWSARYRVRKALVFNPYTLPRVAHALLPMLMLSDLMDISMGRTLHHSVRNAAKRFIMLRISDMGPTEKEQFSKSNAARLKSIFLETG